MFSDLASSQEAGGNRPSRSLRWVVCMVCGYAAAALALLPFAHHNGPQVPAITAFVMAGLLVTDLSTSFLLFVWFRQARSWSLLLLGCAYLFGGAMAILHLLCFPGAVLPGRPIIGTLESPGWAFLLWMGGYAALTLAAVILEAFAARRQVAPEQVGLAICGGAGAVVVAILGCGVTATVLVDRLPPLIIGTSFTGSNMVVNVADLAMLAAAIALVLGVIRQRNTLFLWLSLAITMMLFANILSLVGGGRYTLGWSVGRMSWLVSACVLFLFFMAQFARQQRQLADTQTVLEQRVAKRTADLTLTVRQRDILLREVYHRVNNNLQILDALVALESGRVADPVAHDAFADLHNRIITLGLVHQHLMSSSSLQSFGLAAFLRDVADTVSASFSDADRGVSVVVDADPITVNMDFAIPMGLLATELLAGAIRRGRARTVTMEFRQSRDGGGLLAIGADDDNIGGDGPAAWPESGIVTSLTRQLAGRIGVTYQDGTRVEIRMPLPEVA